MWLVALPAIASGTINVLAPLRIHRLGGGAAAVGAAFLVAAAIEAAISPSIGRISDRRGAADCRCAFGARRRRPCCCSASRCRRRRRCSACSVVAIAAALGAFWAPAMAMLSDAAEARGLDQGLAAALMNLALGRGPDRRLGAPAARTAKAAGDGVPLAVAAGLPAPRPLLDARPAPQAGASDADGPTRRAATMPVAA